MVRRLWRRRIFLYTTNQMMVMMTNNKADKPIISGIFGVLSYCSLYKKISPITNCRSFIFHVQRSSNWYNERNTCRPLHHLVEVINSVFDECDCSSIRLIIDLLRFRCWKIRPDGSVVLFRLGIELPPPPPKKGGGGEKNKEMCNTFNTRDLTLCNIIITYG